MRTILLLLANLGANTGAHICLKLSAGATNQQPRQESRGRLKVFLFWQVLGNLAALLGVLAYTTLLRGMSLHVAYPLTEGLTALGVQLVGSLMVLGEKISTSAWVGTGLIVSGIVLFSF